MSTRETALVVGGGARTWVISAWKPKVSVCPDIFWGSSLCMYVSFSSLGLKCWDASSMVYFYFLIILG
jgi:hypothetical protein